MTCVSNYGCPDLFLTFICNPKWTEMTQHLIFGQMSTDRHYITARIFPQKQNLIVWQSVDGEVKCLMYSIVWQKRRLPHSLLIICLIDKVRCDDIISAEIPDLEIDAELFEIVTKHMVHGPCDQLNPESACIVRNKCRKLYPRPLLADTISGNDVYLFYRQRSPKGNGKTFTMTVNCNDFVVDNSWIVLYSPLLSKTFKTRCNVQFYSSVKSIKYVCKYVNKGSDMAAF